MIFNWPMAVLSVIGWVALFMVALMMKSKILIFFWPVVTVFLLFYLAMFTLAGLKKEENDKVKVEKVEEVEN